MDKDYLQALRYKLQKRVKKLNSSNPEIYQMLLKQFFAFLQEHKTISGIVDELDIASSSNRIIKEVDNISSQYNYQMTIESETDYAATCYSILKRCANSDNYFDAISVGHNLSGKSKHTEALETFNEYFLEPLYEYIDEHLDESGAILSVLRKYKERCEWFRRDSLYSSWASDTQRGEKHLAFDLYEYMHEQGIEFFIEPQSASGEIDMISSQQGNRRLLVDAKIFNPDKDKGKRYISAGFNQVYTYTLDFNNPIGYLVIFKTSEHDLKLALSEGISSAPFVIHNNKTIFFITINIFPHDKSASKRGTLKSVEISSADLLNVQDT
jgi:hypothetical protein